MTSKTKNKKTFVINVPGSTMPIRVIKKMKGWNELVELLCRSSERLWRITVKFTSDGAAFPPRTSFIRQKWWRVPGIMPFSFSNTDRSGRLVPFSLAHAILFFFFFFFVARLTTYVCFCFVFCFVLSLLCLLTYNS